MRNYPEVEKESYSDKGYKLYFGKFLHRLAEMMQVEDEDEDKRIDAQ